jgi:hypothetical protein
MLTWRGIFSHYTIKRSKKPHIGSARYPRLRIDNIVAAKSAFEAHTEANHHRLVVLLLERVHSKIQPPRRCPYISGVPTHFDESFPLDGADILAHIDLFKPRWMDDA